ncbi:MAG: PAS domain S-box protein [Candidatus Lokiarchaeota archaeon]|nr:PAS domain S-box protein [Candidatus Lokiarchaeota archaeon]
MRLDIFNPLENPFTIEEIAEIKKKLKEYTISDIENDNVNRFISFLENKIKKKIVQAKETEKKYRLISENVNDLIGVLNRSFEYEYLNENTFMHTLGYGRDDLLGESVLNYIHPEDLKDATRELNEGFKKGYGSAQIRLHKKAGGWVWVEAKGKIFVDEDGERKALIVSRDITDHKKAEERTQFLSSITEQVKDAIIITNMGFEIIYINKAAEDLYGYEKTDMLGKTPEFLNAEPMAEEIQNEIYQTVLSKNVWTGTHLNKKKDGTTFYCDFKISPLLNDEGHISSFIAIQRDVTPKIVARQKLKDSEERFRMLAEQALAGIFLIQDGVYKYVNKKFSDMTGYSTEELLSWGPNEFFKIIHPEFREFTKTQALKKLRGEKDVINQYQYKGFKKDGEVRWVEQYSNRIEYQGKPAILGIILDITDRKKVENELRESEEKFRIITEKSLSGIAILQDNKYVYINKEFANIIGYPYSEVKNWNLKEFIEIVHPDDKEKVLEQAIKKQKGEKNVINHYEYRVTKLSGEVIWIDNISGTIIFNGRTADLVNKIDITKRKKAEEELLKLNKMKTELLSRISHELKTPLTSIIGYLELLSKEFNNLLRENAIFETFITNIKQGTDRLSQIINNVVKTIKLGSKKLDLKKTKQNLTELIRDCVKDLKSISDLRNHDVIINVEQDIIIKIDLKQIREVLTNLLINAYKFTPPYGSIEISAENKDNYVKIYIKDNGIGITEEEKEIIFTQFGKVEHFGKGFDVRIEGSGLGLYISKKIINLHGGDIGLISEGRNMGSIFYFTLPKK